MFTMAQNTIVWYPLAESCEVSARDAPEATAADLELFTLSPAAVGSPKQRKKGGRPTGERVDQGETAHSEDVDTNILAVEAVS
jgi:hypothetical protein